jgi:uncharacterized membrane protein YfcA
LDRNPTRLPPVLEFPDLSTFVAIVNDPRFALAVAISILSGAVRGFTGFGSALIYVPLMSAVYEPKIAAASFLPIDFMTGIAFAFGVWRQAKWREILPFAAAALLAAQFGALLLQYADANALRWGICLMVAGLVPVLASGWRYHGRPMLAITIAVGLLAGLLGGAVQISGPPVILYWLGSMHHADVVRASFIIYFTLFSAGTMVTYIFHGLLTPEVLALAAVIGPLHILAMWGGSLLYNRASEQTYRRTAYVIIALSAVVAAPVFDGVFR